MMAYIRGLFSWLFGAWEVTERLGRHKASLAKPYLVMAAQKFALDCSAFSISPRPWTGRDGGSAAASLDGSADIFLATIRNLDHGPCGHSSLERVNDYAARLLDALAQDVPKRHARLREPRVMSRPGQARITILDSLTSLSVAGEHRVAFVASRSRVRLSVPSLASRRVRIYVTASARASRKAERRSGSRCIETFSIAGMRFNAVFQRRDASLPPLRDKQAAVDRGGETIVRPRRMPIDRSHSACVCAREYLYV